VQLLGDVLYLTGCPLVSIFGHTASRKTNSYIPECPQCLQLVHNPFTNLCANLRDTCEPCGLFWVSARHLRSSTNMRLAGDRRWHADFCMPMSREEVKPFAMQNPIPTGLAVGTIVGIRSHWNFWGGFRPSWKVLLPKFRFSANYHIRKESTGFAKF